MNKIGLLFFLFLYSLNFLGESYMTEEQQIFEAFKKDTIQKLESKSKLIKTRFGMIEYAEIGFYGPTILEIHGSPGGYDQISETAGFRTIAPSRPGYLRTPLTSGESPKDQAKLFSALLDELNIDSVILKGVSGGGPSAIEFAANYPERTKGLILFEALTHSWTTAEDQSGDLGNFSDFDMWKLLSSLEKNGTEAMISFLIPDVNNQKSVLKSEKNTENLKKLFWSIWPLSLRKDGWENDKDKFKDLSLPLNEIKSPTLIVHGTKDINVDMRHAKKAFQEISKSELYVVEGGDHYMSFSHDEEIEKIISNFIDSL